jgi:hypothetical protein
MRYRCLGGEFVETPMCISTVSSDFWDSYLSLCKTPCAETLIGETETTASRTSAMVVDRRNNKRLPTLPFDPNADLRELPSKVVSSQYLLVWRLVS